MEKGAVFLMRSEEPLIDPFGCQSRCEGVLTGREALRKTQQVRFDPLSFTGKEVTRSPETRRDLVQDHKKAGFSGSTAHLSREPLRIGPNSSGTLDSRLHDEGSVLIALFQDAVDLRKTLVHLRITRLSGGTFGNRKMGHREKERRENLVKEVHPTHGHRANGVSVITALKAEKPAAL